MIHFYSNKVTSKYSSPYFLEELLDKLQDCEILAIDSETSGLSAIDDELLLLQIGDEKNQIVIDIKSLNSEEQDLLKEFFSRLASSRTLLLFQNAKFDLRFLEQFGISIINLRIWDTFLAEKILTNSEYFAKRDLKSLANKYCGVDLDKYYQKHIGKVITDDIIKYAANDIAYLIQIYREQKKEVKAWNLEGAVDLDNRFVKYLALVEVNGFYLDKEQWKVRYEKNLREYEELERQLNQYVIDNKHARFINNQLDLFSVELKVKINWSSSDQVVEYFEYLGYNLDLESDDGTTRQTVEKKHIQKYAKDEIISLYLKYKEIEKDITTYGLNWFDCISPKTNRIHTNFNQLMDTGRLSSGGKEKDLTTGKVKQNPNLQNIPNDKITRGCFKAQGDNVLVVSDFSQQEVVILANKSQEENLVKFFTSGSGDVHSFIAKLVFKDIIPQPLTEKEVKDQYPDLRTRAKSATFALSYGGSGITIANNLGLTKEEGDEIMMRYMQAFPGLAEYFSKCKAHMLYYGNIIFNDVTQRRYDMSKSHREYKELSKLLTREFWDRYKIEKELDSKLFKDYYKPTVKRAFQVKGNLERVSLNYPIQATGADMLKLAVCMFYERICLSPYNYKGIKIVNLVHDEIIVECCEELAPFVSEVLKQSMEDASRVFLKSLYVKAEPITVEEWTK